MRTITVLEEISVNKYSIQGNVVFKYLYINKSGYARFTTRPYKISNSYNFLNFAAKSAVPITAIENN